MKIIITALLSLTLICPAFALETYEDIYMRANANTLYEAAAGANPLTTNGVYDLSEFTPNEENIVYYTSGSREYGAELYALPTPEGFEYSDSGVATVSTDTSAEDYVSLWFNKNHSVSNYTAGILLGAAESANVVDAVSNQTNVRLVTYVWEEGAESGTRDDDRFIIIENGNDRTRHWFDEDYEAVGNEALEFRLYTTSYPDSTQSGYSHVIFNLYADTTPTAEEEADAKTDLPEPASIAYAALGLVSLAGMRRKIKK